MFKKIMFYVLAGFLATGLFAGRAAEARTLKMSGLNPASSLETELLDKYFVQYVNNNSNGRLKIDFYPGSALGNTETVVQGLLLGSVDLMYDSAGNLNQFCKNLALLDLPYVINREELVKILGTPVGKKLLDTGKETGITLIGLVAAFNRNIISRKPMRALAELKGAKDRTTGSNWQILGVKSMGLNPVPIPAAEMLTAIQQGVVDCMDINMPSMLGYRIADVAKHVLLTNHAEMICGIASSTEFWEDLSQEDRDLISKAWNNFTDEFGKALDAKTKDLIAQLEKAGCEVTSLSEKDNATLRETTLANIEKELTPGAKALLLEIREALKK